MTLATSSLPTPDSPVMSTGWVLRAMASMYWKMERMVLEQVTMGAKASGCSRVSCRKRVRRPLFSRRSSRISMAWRMPETRLLLSLVLTKKSKAPALDALHGGLDLPHAGDDQHGYVWMGPAYFVDEFLTGHAGHGQIDGHDLDLGGGEDARHLGAVLAADDVVDAVGLEGQGKGPEPRLFVVHEQHGIGGIFAHMREPQS